ncbi:histidine triad nucleotide-binding 4 [Wolffia australiana]
MAGLGERQCVFCQIAQASTPTTLLYRDDSIVAFPDIDPSAFRHYLVIPRHHISTVKNLKQSTEDYELVKHMLNVGKNLLSRDAPSSQSYRFGFHVPPFNSVDHLHLHCLALPFVPRWREIKYVTLGPLPGFMEAQRCLARIKP